VKPNDRLTAPERLEIYNRSTGSGFRFSYEDFPGLRAVLGDRRFTNYGGLSNRSPFHILHEGRLGRSWKVG